MAAVDWTLLPGHVIAGAIRRGEVTARSVAEAHLAAIAARNGDLLAVTDVTADRALRAAAAIDRARSRGEPLPPLAGVPYAVKNLVDVAGLVTRAGSRIERTKPPATADAAVVRRLDAAGAILVGALHMGEYAYDFTGRNAHDGRCANPHDRGRLTGGSSSGSGAAAAAGFAAITVGSDTNGSIRVPASFCGLFGLKPTYGAVSRAGTFPFVASLDHIGPLARSALDCALAFDAMAGHDAADPVSSRRPQAPVAPELPRGTEALRLAVAGGYFRRMGQPEAYAAVDAAAAALGITQMIEVPEAAAARAAAYVITMIEGGALHRERLREHAADFDPEVRDRLIAGNLLPGAWLVRAQMFRRLFRDRMLALLEGIDAFLTPATPCVAPPADQMTLDLDGETVPLRPNIGVYTQPISFIGFPAMVVPLPTAGGLPIGVQIVAAPGREDILLRIAHRLETAGVTRSVVAMEAA